MSIEGIPGAIVQTEPLDDPDAPWRKRLKADLEAQLEAGATLYCVRPDGAYVARTKHGDRVIREGSRKKPAA